MKAFASLRPEPSSLPAVARGPEEPVGIEGRGIGDRAELPGPCAGPPLHDCPGWPAATRTGPNVRPPGHCQGIEVATQPFAATYRPDHPEQFACSANSFAIE